VFDTATPPRVINESFKKLNGVVTEGFDLRYWPLLRERRSLGSNPRNCVGERPTIRLNARLKWPDEGGVDEARPSKILIPARCAQMPEMRPAAF